MKQGLRKCGTGRHKIKRAGPYGIYNLSLMETIIEIKPDKKLMTKNWYGLLTFTFSILVIAVCIQIFAPLDPEVTHKDVAGPL